MPSLGAIPANIPG